MSEICLASTIDLEFSKKRSGISDSRAITNANRGFAVYCYRKSFAPAHDFIIKQLAEGKTHEQAVDAYEAALKSGKLQRPPAGTMTYIRQGKDAASAKTMWRILLPNATAESLGLPSKPGQGAPWSRLNTAAVKMNS